ncbi:MAG: phosphotransferase [Myxococcota bacterium]
MAVLTPLPLADAQRILDAHGLFQVAEVTPIAAGSVNSNFFVESAKGERVFVRLYEEQETSGVAYEWALLKELQGALPLAKRFEGPAPGELRVAKRCVAVFDVVEGASASGDALAKAHLEALGDALARAHEAAERFGWRRRSRFGADGLIERLSQIDVRIARLQDDSARNESVKRELEVLCAGWPELRARIEAAMRAPLATVPMFPVHGDLFPDNALWKGAELQAVLDWESAADGPAAEDLAVVLLAWTYTNDFDAPLGRAFFRAYGASRPLGDADWAALAGELTRMAARFTATRIADFFLRRLEAKAAGDTYLGVYKRYEEFVDRLDRVGELGQDGLRERLT